MIGRGSVDNEIEGYEIDTRRFKDNHCHRLGQVGISKTGLTRAPAEGSDK